MAHFPIDGIVTDSAGKPLAGVAISFSMAPVSLPEIAMLSDANGAFRMTVPVAGSYELSFSTDGFRPLSVRMEVPRTASSMRVKMRPV